MKAPETKPIVNIMGERTEEGNAYSIMGRVSEALEYAGADEEYIKKYQAEARSGDYDHLLEVSRDYVDEGV